MKKTIREIGDDFEKEVNKALDIKSTINSGSSDRYGNSLGYDHSSERIVGESKVKSKNKRPVITQKEFDKLKRKAVQEGHKDWLFFVKYNEGKEKAVILDFNFFAEIWHKANEKNR